MGILGSRAVASLTNASRFAITALPASRYGTGDLTIIGKNPEGAGQGARYRREVRLNRVRQIARQLCRETRVCLRRQLL